MVSVKVDGEDVVPGSSIGDFHPVIKAAGFRIAGPPINPGIPLVKNFKVSGAE